MQKLKMDTVENKSAGTKFRYCKYFVLKPIKKSLTGTAIILAYGGDDSCQEL